MKDVERTMSEEEKKEFLKEHPYLIKLNDDDIRRLAADLLIMLMKVGIGKMKHEEAFPLKLLQYSSD